MAYFFEELLSKENETKGKHILYYYTDEESYILNAMSFIHSFKNEKAHIIFIENDRNTLLLRKRMEQELTSEQMEKLHFFNNFDFYYSEGNFHPQTILNYFSNYISPYIENGEQIYTWGHVEWGDLKEISQKIEEYETHVGKLTIENQLVSLCAYNESRTPDELREILIRCHEIIFSDRDVIPLK